MKFLARGLGVKVKGRVEKQDCNEQCYEIKISQLVKHERKSIYVFIKFAFKVQIYHIMMLIYLLQRNTLVQCFNIISVSFNRI